MYPLSAVQTKTLRRANNSSLRRQESVRRLGLGFCWATDYNQKWESVSAHGNRPCHIRSHGMGSYGTVSRCSDRVVGRDYLDLWSAKVCPHGQWIRIQV